MVSSLTWWSKCHLKGTGYTAHTQSKALWDWREAQNISAIHLYEVYEIPGWIVHIFFSFFFIRVRMRVLCCHDNSSLYGTEPIAALTNSLPFLASLCKNLIHKCSQAGLAGDCPQLEQWYQYSMWPDHHQWIIRLAQAHTTGLVYRYSLDDPSRWRVKVSVAMTNTAVTYPPSTLLANWPSKTLSTKHDQLGSAGAKANRTCL